MDSSNLITFVTGNPKTLEEVEAILGPYLSQKIISRNIDLPEYQGTPHEICTEKCREAYRKMGGPVIVEDTTLCCNALGGIQFLIPCTCNSTTIIDWCCVILPFTVKVAWLLLWPFLPSVWSHIVMANAPTALFAIFGSSSHCFFFSMNTSLDSRQYGSAKVPILIYPGSSSHRSNGQLVV